ncbi:MULTISPECIES: glycerate kinase [unclassified Mycolicibacterium]|uniref:glycerate kinase n=1 Tax=unclassified Mycolicibacterium TaxID=2636767 RepID=UPI0012DE4397|nr:MULTISPECIES: glycerate kinase [unclassified Mycolicibacterium]MUL80482.1 glycerate kinase [Mycolicibacterium sp. CBMA 329]MUL86249.1 glycerate kinase [Mycolicibacterium sp. CBMA 331]MUM01089.1 glycerate kinase [Mycolicibacterium sp. CBMA 334]MUM24982.1 glycerate kinase [Mycolicibacterium sp. CBMA 295]MUM36545.1 glycerate kinase [Mycolicibacterium sp. CBMA 247]
MKIVLAPDSFKESMTASQAVAAMREGVRMALPGAECVGVPMADGGEGTVDAVVDALGGDRVTVEVKDPLGRPARATYGYVADRHLAVIEMASASGLELVAPADRDILRASTFGVGQLIASALDRGAAELLIGLGGSATNDGGAGMLTALGVSFSDSDGSALPPGGAALARLQHIDVAGLDPRLAHVRVRIASDVTAPLLGTGGASAVFGPQKGATPADVEVLETALTRLVDVTETALGHARPDRAGAGAAGGLGFGLMEFLAAECDRGVEVIAQTVGLEQSLTGADWVFTGEGSVDAQTMLGKTPFGVAQVAARTGTRVVIFAGRVAPDADVLLSNGVEKLVAITAPATPLDQALREGPGALARATAEVCRAIAP